MILKNLVICLFPFLILSQCVSRSYFQEDARYQPAPGKQIKPAPEGQVWVIIAPQYQKSKVHEWIWGRHYRQLWATPVLVPVLNIRQAAGGLTPLELGGGLQTTSLTLKDRKGRLYALRTLDKDPTQILPSSLQKSFLGQIMRDQTSAMNPFGAFILPPLARAAGVFHANPRIYYVPLQDNGLGSYSKHFAGKVVMLEEKFKGRASIIPAFGEATDLIDTQEMLKKRFRSNQYRVDQLEFAKARLFDVLISDWDRHEGQWNWLEYQNSVTGQVTYKPIPKDRDHAFYRFRDGLIPWIGSRRLLVGKIGIFRHNLPGLAGLTYSARFLDQRFLNEVNAEQWARVATDMKAALSEQVLTQSVSLYPDSIYALEGKKTLSLLREGVEKLPSTASELYRLLAREVTIAGSDEPEKFLVKRIDDHTTSVEVLSIPARDDEKPRQLYYRVFPHQHTEKLTLHGLGEDDEFLVSGKVAKGIRIDIYGGPGEDKVTDKSQVGRRAPRTFVYDTRQGNKLNLGKSARDKTTSRVRVHAYDREGH